MPFNPASANFASMLAASPVRFQGDSGGMNWLQQFYDMATVGGNNPTLTSISPTTAAHSSTVTVTLTGTNYIAADTVQAGTKTLPDTFVSATSMTVSYTTPATAGTVSFTVSRPMTGVTTAAQTFTVT